MEKPHPNIETPRVPVATRPDNPVFREVHEETDRALPLSGEIILAREKLFAKYGITPERTIILPQAEEGERQRKIRAFSILQNLKDRDLSFYAEGNCPHALLFQKIIKEYQKEIDTKDLLDLDFDLWRTMKGFLDPNQNGFNSFPDTKKALLSMLEDNLETNGFSEEEFSKMKKDLVVPNWFLSGDSEYHKK